MRSRTVIRPLACWRATRSSPPSCAASCSRRASSSSSGCQFMVAQHTAACERGTLSLAMSQREPRLVALGYGRWVRADRIFALVPLDPEERGDGRRTYVHVDGVAAPLVASRSEKAILADVERALVEAAGVSRGAGARGDEPGR